MSPLTLTLTCHYSPSPSHVTTHPHPHMSPLTFTLTCHHSPSPSHITTHLHPHMSPLTLTLTCHHSPSPSHIITHPHSHMSPLTSPAAPEADSATAPLLLAQTRGHSPTAEEAREVDGTAGQLQENTLLLLSVGELPHTAAHREIPLHVIYISGKAPCKGNMSRVYTSM